MTKWFNSMFDELKEVKNVIYLRTKTFEKSSKSKGVFRIQGNIFDGAFL